MRRWRERVAAWQAARVLAAADVLGLAPEAVRPSDVWAALVVSRHPGLLAPMPTMGRDRRFGPRRRCVNL